MRDRHLQHLLVAVVGLGSLACDAPTHADGPAVLAAIHVVPDGVDMPLGATTRFLAIPLDNNGDTMPAIPVRWLADDASIATITDSGIATGIHEGRTAIRAIAEAASGTADLQVYTTGGGSARISVPTTGTDLDSDGFTVVADGSGEWQRVAINATAVLLLPVGNHTITLNDVARNCGVGGANPRSTAVSKGAITDIAFVVTCGTAAALVVAASTAGPDPDPDGFVVYVDAGFPQGFETSVPSNGQVLVSPLAQGTHTIRLGGAATNCATPAAASVTLIAGDTGRITFNIDCEALATIALTLGNLMLAVVRSNGTNLVALPVAGIDPSWSPDGRRIAFTGFSNTCVGACVIKAIGADGTGLVELGPGRDPSWSPNGDRIAFVLDTEGDRVLATMQLDGSNVVSLTGTSSPGSVLLEPAHPAWSPDGARVAFSCDIEAGNRDICVINADGSGLRRLTSDPARDDRPAWSPDGTHLAFATERNGTDAYGNALIALMNADGTGVQGFAWGDAPAWSPDGGRLAYRLFGEYCEYYGCYPVAEYLVTRTDGRADPTALLDDGRMLVSGLAWKP